MINGYADIHCHPMAHLSFGGEWNGRSLFWGKPTDALSQALPCCSSAHSFWRGEGILSRFVPCIAEPDTKSYDGFDTFDSWPRPTTTIHQQMYIEQIRRAYSCGLRLLVASAVNNELLTDVYHSKKVNADDGLAIERQLDGMRRLARQNSTWMSIVEGPQEARDAIKADKLAIILGIEVDSIAGARMRRDCQLDPFDAKAIVDRWWQEGVRLINPIHLVDNALGGTAIYDDRFNCLNNYLIGKWAPHLPKPWYFAIESACSESNVRFLLSADRKKAGQRWFYSLWKGQCYPPYIKNFGSLGHVNARGLSNAGEAFIQAMMQRGMLIDVEHMSSRALQRTLDIAENQGYPLLSSHTALRALAVERRAEDPFIPGCAHEAMRTDEELGRIKRHGGVLGVGGHVGRIAKLQYDVSRNWAKTYQYAIERLQFDSVAIGTDMNGFAETPGPRFERIDRYPSCLQPIDSHDKARAIEYEKDHVPKMCKVLRQTALGRRKYDYNVDGLAHYGLLPDFTLDVALSLGGEEKLGAFFRSAEAVVTAWSTCVAQSVSRN